VIEIKNSIFNLTKSNFRFSCCELTKINLESEILPEELDKYQLLSNPKRKKEFEYVRFLRTLQIGKKAIRYDTIGKPNVKDKKIFISISHSKNFVAFANDTSPIGIDIEELNPRILKVWSRYLHPEEFAIFDTTSIFDLTVAWTIKEALFKLNTKTGIDFKNDLRIKSKEGNTFICEMKSEDGFQTVKMETCAYKNLIISYNINQ
jgi:phosphopantetheinyl transferase